MKSYAIKVEKVGGQWQLVDTGSGHSAHSIGVPAGEQGVFEYQIVGSGGVKFANSNPIWIQQGSAKPCGPVVDTQIQSPSGGGTNKLTFTDLNQGNATTLTYSLHFSDGSQLDPIITNGGGTISQPVIGITVGEIAAYVGIGLIVGLVIAYAWKRLSPK